MMAPVDIEAIYRSEAGRVLATLIRLLGGFEAAEEALHDAFAAAAEQWPREGMPRNPRAWLVSAGRFKAIDRIRRRARHEAAVAEIGRGLEEASEDEMDAEIIADDQLRLIFTCCHPVLSPDQQVALALREICGLTTEQIAASFLAKPSALAQRIVRAKNRIRDEKVPYAVPERDELPDRLLGALHTIYLVFNEGYSTPAAGGADLAREAIRLGRLLADLLPEPDVLGLLGLMLLNESRRAARTDAAGDLVLLADQDRDRWDRAMIAEGVALAQRAMAAPGAFSIEAIIAAIHALSPNAAATDWRAIAAYYDLLFAVRPTPVVALNRAVAIAERDGAAAGLAIVDQLLASGELANYHLAHATRAELNRRLGHGAAARAAYRRALELARDPADRRFLERRLVEAGGD